MAERIRIAPEEINIAETPLEVYTNLDNIDNLKEKLEEVFDLELSLSIETLRKYAKAFFKHEEYATSARLFEKIYDKDNKERYSLLNAAFILSAKLNEHSISNALLNKFLTKDPNFAEAHYNLACNYIRTKSVDKALNEINVALELNPQLCANAIEDKALEPIWNEISSICKSNNS